MPTVWSDSFTHEVATHGEHPSFGEGALGPTDWTPPTEYVTAWQDQFLHDSAEFGGVQQPGEGGFGGPTDWENITTETVRPPIVPIVVAPDTGLLDAEGLPFLDTPDGMQLSEA